MKVALAVFPILVAGCDAQPQSTKADPADAQPVMAPSSKASRTGGDRCRIAACRPGKYAPPGYETDMPAFGGTLSDDEIRAVPAFIKSHWKSKALLDSRAEMIRNIPRR